MKSIFGTKAGTLRALQGRLTHSHVCDCFIFTVAQWRDARDHLLDQIAQQFSPVGIIVRSSALREDGDSWSMAGAYNSVKDVDSTSPEKIMTAVLQVIASYGPDDGDANEVLIQPMIDNVSMSGVVFSHDLSTGAPYYVVNYDDETGLTDTVTSGTTDSSRTLLIHREHVDQLYSPRFRALIRSVQEIEAILASPDRSTWIGRRDHAMFLTLYNSGARVSEMTALKPSQVYFGERAFVHLHGKGRKEREIPLWKTTARILKSWLRENPNDSATVFPNAQGGTLSSDGVSYLLRKAVNRAAVDCPSLDTKRVTPHVLRHSTAMHLLQSGVDLSVIALWLGHESIETTHIYVEADLATKERALQTLTAVGTSARRFKADEPLMAFLSAL